jgi:pyruvate dehydrogenase E2 component (dihydrolipoamide acetyltransferase)
MATYEYILPELGEGIDAGDVVQVLVAVGDTITKDQPLLELETDKAVIEVPAPVDGVVQTMHVQAGDKVTVGQLIVTLQTAATTAQAVAQAPRQEVHEVGVAIPAIPMIEASQEQQPETVAAEHQARPVAVTTASSSEQAAAAPSVRRLAREIGVEIALVTGSGPAGRITADDVKAHARRLLVGANGVPATPQRTTTGAPDFSRWGAVERHAMSNVRRATAETMSHAWTTIPHVTQFGKADITELEQLRQRYAPRADAMGGKLTITAIVLKAVVAALKRFPQFNASVDMAQHEVIFKQYYHIGVAVDTDRGLLVPVIRDVDHKSLLRLSVELTEVAEKARTRKTGIEDLQGGTFTVTNLGGIGGTHFAPIIHPPEVAILGLGRSDTEAVYRNGQFEPRLMLPLALSYDHRVIDGADGARFIRWISETLQQPFLIALEG